MGELLSRLLTVSVAAGILTATPVLRAADAFEGERLQQARRVLLQRAKERYDAGRGGGADARQQLQGALDALRLAYQLTPAPWLLFNLAQVQSQLGACQEAAELYRRFLASEPGPEARASAEQASSLLGTCEASNSQPALDDALAPGLRWASGLDTLSASSAPSPLPVSGENPAADAEGARVWPWALAGIAATAGVTAAVFYGEARAAKQDLERIRVGGPQVAETQHRGASELAAARAFGGVALGFGLVSAASFWWPRAAPDEAPPAAALTRLSWLPLERGAGAAYWFEF